MFVHVLKIWYSANCTVGRRNSYLVTECKFWNHESRGMMKILVSSSRKNEGALFLCHICLATCTHVTRWKNHGLKPRIHGTLRNTLHLSSDRSSLSLFLSHFKHIPISLFPIWKNEGTEISTCRLLLVWRLPSHSRVFSPVCYNIRHHIPDPRISVKQGFGKVRNHRQVAYELCWRTTLSLHTCIKHLHLLTLLILNINFQHIKSEFIRVSL